MLDPGEESLFKHRASVKGNDGELLVTSSRIMVLFTKTAPNLQFSWPSVTNVKYSAPNDPKGRALVLLKTMVSGNEDCIIRLTGSSTDSRFSELERLKGIISNIRKSKGTTDAAIVGSKRSTSSSLDLASSGEVKRRKQLLDADKHLAKQYKELVEDSKCISDEDFWHNRAELPMHSTSGTTIPLAKGKTNSLISDIFEVGADGEIRINLTVEKRRNIFLMNPAVRRAFEAEVPLKRSEASFWEAYFRSEFYNSQQMNNRGGSSNLPAGINHRDLGMIARYEEDEKPAQSQDSELSSSGQQQQQVHLRLSGKVSDSIDLTATYGDHVHREQLDASDHLPAVTSASAAASTVAAAGASGDAGRKVVAKYNKNSLLIMGTDPSGANLEARSTADLPSALERLTTATTVTAETGVASKRMRKHAELAESTKLSELEKAVEVAYIPITLSWALSVSMTDQHTAQSTSSAAAGEERGTGLQEMQDKQNATEVPMSPPSAFVTSSSRRHRDSKEGIFLPRPSKATNGIVNIEPLNSLETSQERHDGNLVLELPPAGLLVSDLASCVPSAERSAALFQSDIMLLRKATHCEERGFDNDPLLVNNTTQQSHLIPHNNSSSSSSGINIDEDRNLASFLWLDSSEATPGLQSSSTSQQRTRFRDSSELLEPQFAQAMLESFTDVTELLMHFYVMLARGGSTSMEKAGAILQRLQEHVSVSLENKKMQLNTAHRQNIRQRQQQQQQQQQVLTALSVGHKTVGTEAEQMLEAKVSVINGMLQLIQRARTAWTIFQHHGHAAVA